MTRLLTLLLSLSTAAAAADVKVIAIGALNPGFNRIAERYKAETGNTVTVTMDTATGVTRRLAAGESADVLIAPDTAIDDAVKQGKAIESTKTPVARVGIGIAMRRALKAPNLATADALKQALLAADSIVYNQGSSGLYIDKLLEQMGITDRVKAKIVRYANAAQVVDHVMNGKGNDVGFAPLPEIINNDQTRVQLAGPLPPGAQNYTNYVAAAMTGKNTDLAKDFIRYATTPVAKQIFASSGVD
jgi:molybdate transport system substrate-binding protein